MASFGSILEDSIFTESAIFECFTSEESLYNLMESSDASVSTSDIESSGAENGIYQNNCGPYLRFTIPPVQNHRFRYKSENGSHGCIAGFKADNSKKGKTFPTVELRNYNSNHQIVIKASLYTDTDPRLEHVFELDGQCTVELDDDNKAEFRLSVKSKKLDEVDKIIRDKRKKKGGRKSNADLENEIKKEKELYTKSSSVLLCFKAFEDDELIGQPLFSRPIYNPKSNESSDLRIVKMSHCSGSCEGGDQVILLCDKLKKEKKKISEDVRIYFSDGDDWGVEAQFEEKDIHHQVAITFQTPKYKGNINAEVNVYLYKISTNQTSNHVPFQYILDEDYDYKPKRKRPNNCEDVKNHECVSRSESVASASSARSSESGLLTPFSQDIVDLDKFLDDVCGEMASPATGSLATDAVAMQFSSMHISNDTNETIHRNLESDNKLDNLISGVSSIFQNKKEDFCSYLKDISPVQDKNGNTLLHLAVKEDDPNFSVILEILKGCPEIAKIKNKLGKTALQLATAFNQPKIVGLLLRYGGDPSISDKDGNNCFHVAARNDLVTCMRALLKFSSVKQCVNSYNNDGLTPLHLAVMNNSHECLYLLLHNGADVNARDKKSGSTALHLAIQSQPSVIHLILDRPDTDAQCENYAGISPLKVTCDIKELIYEDLPSNVKEENTAACEFLKKVFSNCEGRNSWNDKAEKEFVTAERNRIYTRIEDTLCKMLNGTGEWKKLGIFLNYTDKQLDTVKEFEENPAKSILQKVKKSAGIETENILEIANLVEPLNVYKLLQNHYFP